MPRTEAIAKKDLEPFFKKGDKITIVPILYEEDTVIVNEIYSVFNGEKLVKFFDPMDRKLNGLSIRKIFDKQYAPKGSYKDSYIELENGNKYPSSLVRDYNDFFEKIH